MSDEPKGGPMLRRQLEITNKLGLHARAATVLIQTIQKFDVAVRLIKDSTEVDATSIIALLMLDAGQGTVIDVCVSGSQAQEALEAISALFADRFGEEL